MVRVEEVVEDPESDAGGLGEGEEEGEEVVSPEFRGVGGAREERASFVN